MNEEKIKLGPRLSPARHGVLKPIRILRSDLCINCGRCVDACIYGCHQRSETDIRQMADPKPYCCRRCFSCILNCPRGALSMHPNDEFRAMGNSTYPPEAICSIQEQSSEGKIPVSGAGYGGPFDGEGYDNIWTDMSEIVRPTRDGIHGREHISTTVNIGAMIEDICFMKFDDDENLKELIPPTREIPIPVLFGTAPFGANPTITRAMALAASQLTTYLTVPANDIPDPVMEYFNHLIIQVTPAQIYRAKQVVEWATIIEVLGDEHPKSTIEKARTFNPRMLVIHNAAVSAGAPERVLALVKGGAEVVHLAADIHGKGADGSPMLKVLEQVHGKLVRHGLRDRITLLASGGIAIAEHVPKTILMGADAVIVDVPLMIALECDLCDKCESGEICPKELDDIDVRWGAARIINLMLCWRDQLLEVLGAMGIRDVRRLRGEKGRAIFADQVKKDFVRRLGNASPSKPDSSVKSKKQSAAAEVSPAPTRFATIPGSYRVVLDLDKCTDCGLCVEACQSGVFRRVEGYNRLEQPADHLCIGDCCTENEWCCTKVCPWHAIEILPSETDAVLGDRRWTAELLRRTYQEARTGRPVEQTGGDIFGASGGGFDKIALQTGAKNPSIKAEDVDLSISLNKRTWGPRVHIPFPIYGGGMSYGSISLQVMKGRAMAAQRLGTFTCTGEGGYPDDLIPYADHVITQVATGLFGVREQTIARAPIAEFKYAQGAKPGLGGHLLAEKNTPDVATMREAVPGTGLFSPFPFHSVYSVEDHKKHVDWLRSIKPDLLVSVKVSTPGDVDMVAVGSFHAGANIIHLDGAYGGTGAAPDIAKKNIAMPIEYAVSQVHDFLAAEGIRDDVTLIASGGVRSADDVLKAIALGADGVVIGTAELVAVDCVRCGNCERDRGCPIGIATTDRKLAPQMTSEWVRDRIVNLYIAWGLRMKRRLAALGLTSIRQLVGRRDLLSFLEKGGKA